MRAVSFQDGARLGVAKILCLGRNYVEHAKEMGAEVPASPVVFLKPATALVQSGESVIIPSISNDVHHEVEMVVVLGREGRNIRKEDALDYVAGYGVGIDLTLRDLQTEAKKKGLPWTIAKGFDTSAPVSTIVRKEKIPDPHSLEITLRVNGEIRQKSNTRNMIFKTDAVVSYLSSVFTLEPGDLIFMGTPEGVGKINAGDIIEAELESVATLRVDVRAETPRSR
jgi:acylpyruvate hydrolase